MARPSKTLYNPWSKISTPALQSRLLRRAWIFRASSCAACKPGSVLAARARPARGQVVAPEYEKAAKEAFSDGTITEACAPQRRLSELLRVG